MLLSKFQIAAAARWEGIAVAALRRYRVPGLPERVFMSLMEHNAMKGDHPLTISAKRESPCRDGDTAIAGYSFPTFTHHGRVGNP